VRAGFTLALGAARFGLVANSTVLRKSFDMLVL